MTKLPSFSPIALETDRSMLKYRRAPGHHVLLGLKLQEAMTKLGLDCAVRSPDHEGSEFELVEEFIAAKLTE